MSVHRAARYAAYAAAVLAILIVGAALLVPIFLDTPAVEHEIQAKLSQLVQGEVAWERLSIRLLPSPRGSLRKVSAEIPGVAAVRAEQVDAHLRLVPLLYGRAEIASVSLSHPVARLELAPPASAKAPPSEQASPLEAYRSVVDTIRQIAPEAEIDVEDGEIEIVRSGMPPIRVWGLEVRGRSGSNGASIELTAAGEAWSRLTAEASVGFADYSGKGKLELVGLKAQPWLDSVLEKSPVRIAVPEASVSLEARSDGKNRLEAAFKLDAGAVELLRSAERVALPGVAVGGTVSATGEELALRVTSARLGASRLADGNLRYSLKSNALATVADFDLDIAQAMDATRRLLTEDAGKELARFQPASGRAQGQAKFDLRGPVWSVRVDVRKSDSAIGVEGLPGPVKLASATVGVTRDAVKIERADLALLDARALASATIGFGKQLGIEGTVSEGSAGENLLAWVWRTAGVPPRLMPRTPVGIAVQRATWAPKRPLDLAATASFDSGPSVAVDLGWTPQALDIRRAAIKDAKSDAVLALHLEKHLLQGRFSGSLQSASLGAMLKAAKVPEGGAGGDLRFRFDLDHPERFSATGKLQGTSVDLSWLLERPVMVERFEVQADGEKLGVREASVNWAQQRFAVSGEVARAPDGAPIIDAWIESPGVTVDALLQKAAVVEPEPAAGKAKAAKPDEPLWKLWPLPVRGQVALRSKFIQYGERKAEPVVATLALEDKRAFLELQQVQLCGISFPLTVEARPDGFSIAVRLAAQNQQLEQTARCLTERGVLMTGEFDLRADLRTQGKLPGEAVPNLEGTVEAVSRDGKVMKFEVLGNILSAQNVTNLFKEGGPKLDEKGFPYRTLSVSGHFDKGKFQVDKSGFVSDAVGLAATGWISLGEGYESELNVLVAPLGFLNQLVRKIPLLGDVGGTITSVPVRVSGDIRHPRVVPLGIRAVGSQLIDILQETVKVPTKLIPKEQSPGDR